MKTVHGEIEYLRSDNEKVHSDICPPKCNSDNLKREDYRKFIHDCLDKWLDESNGTCGFYLKDENYKFDFQDEEFSNVVQTMFVFAARYVHNRSTGGTLAVCTALKKVWPRLSDHTKEQIIRESHEATANLEDWEEFRKYILKQP